MRRALGLTLVEALMALAVLAVLGGALASLQLGALRSGRTARLRQVGAQLLADELLLRRLAAGQPAGCAVQLMPGWSCQAHSHCHAAWPACLLVSFEVRLVGPDGAELVGHGARFEPLLVPP